MIADATSLSKDFGLRNQVLDSSGSVMDNIAEGFERDGKKEFMNFLYYSKGAWRNEVAGSPDLRFRLYL